MMLMCGPQTIAYLNINTNNALATRESGIVSYQVAEHCPDHCLHLHLSTVPGLLNYII